MAERKLPMGAKEIVASYRTARNPKAQIGVLADLNGCSQKEIEEVLIQLGAMKPTERKKPNPRKIDVDAAAARELLEQGMTDEEAASALGTAEHDTGGKEQSESAEMVGGHAEPYVTVAKLHDILTAALAGKMGHAAVTVQGQRFRSMALRISYTIGGEDQGPTAELVAEPLE